MSPADEASELRRILRQREQEHRDLLATHEALEQEIERLYAGWRETSDRLEETDAILGELIAENEALRDLATKAGIDEEAERPASTVISPTLRIRPQYLVERRAGDTWLAVTTSHSRRTAETTLREIATFSERPTPEPAPQTSG